MSKGKELFDKGAIQLSRKYRHVGVLPEGKTGVEMMEKVDPEYVRHRRELMERDCAEQFLRVYGCKEDCTYKLTEEEFSEFLEEKRKRSEAHMKELDKKWREKSDGV